MFRGFAHSPLMVASLLGALALSGCQASPKGSGGAGSSPHSAADSIDASLERLARGEADRAGDSAAASSDINAIAAQSQRDVDAILRSQAAGGQPAPATRTPIVWNELRKPSPSPQPPGDGSSGAAVPGGRSGQPAAKRDLDRPAEANLPNQPDASTAASAGGAGLPADRLRQLSVDLARELYTSGAYSDTPLRELLVIASMSMIDPERKLEPGAIPDLTEKERELLGNLQTFFADLGRSLNGANDQEAAIIDAVGRLRQALVRQPALQLPTVALCTRVGGFGDFNPFERNSFLAHSEQRAIVYIEIGAFTSTLNEKREFVTELSQQLTIYSDRDGIPVWKEDWQTAVDIIRNQRKDFYTTQVITLPKALGVGKYTLKVRVRDDKSEAEAEASVPFEMVADPKLAAGAPQK